jgi:hypothetical protein
MQEAGSSVTHERGLLRPSVALRDLSPRALVQLQTSLVPAELVRIARVEPAEVEELERVRCRPSDGRRRPLGDRARAGSGRPRSCRDRARAWRRRRSDRNYSRPTVRGRRRRGLSPRRSGGARGRTRREPRRDPDSCGRRSCRSAWPRSVYFSRKKSRGAETNRPRRWSEPAVRSERLLGLNRAWSVFHRAQPTRVSSFTVCAPTRPSVNTTGRSRRFPGASATHPPRIDSEPIHYQGIWSIQPDRIRPSNRPLLFPQGVVYVVSRPVVALSGAELTRVR